MKSKPIIFSGKRKPESVKQGDWFFNIAYFLNVPIVNIGS